MKNVGKFFFYKYIEWLIIGTPCRVMLYMLLQ